MVVDQEVLDLAVSTDVYDITFGDVVEFPVTMRWGSRVNLTWYVQPISYIILSLAGSVYNGGNRSSVVPLLLQLVEKFISQKQLEEMFININININMLAFLCSLH